MGPTSRPGRAVVHDVRVSAHAGSEEGRLHATLRGDDERVLPLELFFDLVFVLAITQCTALMAHEPTWAGVGKGLLVLGILWWTWIGYAWLTSVVDPEEGIVRLLIIAAMAALLVVSLCVPHVFGDYALLFACCITIVRVEHIALFILGSRDDPGLRVIGDRPRRQHRARLRAPDRRLRSRVTGRPWIWLLALVLDMAGPKFFGLDGWRLVPGHYAERFGLIVLIALGESIVAIGAGSGEHVDTGIVIGAILGVAVSASLFWLYFDVVALVAARRLSNATPGREQNGIARDSFTYLHLPMVAGIVLVALGFKKTLAHVHAHLHVVPASALLGGTALYLLAHVAFRWRNVHRLTIVRLVVSGFCVAMIAAGDAHPGDRHARRARGRAGRADRVRATRASPSCASACGTSSQNDERPRRQRASGASSQRRSVVRERVEHVQARGPACGQRAGEDAGDGAGRDQRDQLTDRHRERHLQRVHDEGRDRDAEREPEDATDVRRQHALVAHRAAHLAARGADGPHQADLAGALEHRQDQRVDDAEERDDQAQREHDIDQRDDLVRVGLVLRPDLVVALHPHAVVAIEVRRGSRPRSPGRLLPGFSVARIIAASVVLKSECQVVWGIT